jgi:hypothetical protein
MMQSPKQSGNEIKQSIKSRISKNITGEKILLMNTEDYLKNMALSTMKSILSDAFWISLGSAASVAGSRIGSGDITIQGLRI